MDQVEAREIYFPAIDILLKGRFPAAAKTVKPRHTRFSIHH